ncbi:serine/threonine-protein kinase [Nonomuraea sp. NPDC049129]|uniref:serine/threonine-protein kinase n=1 Tax=Nonomuraea sp. NPDC049129 TaxID=3155272 RepID=UPI0033FFBDD6
MPWTAFPAMAENWPASCLLGPAPVTSRAADQSCAWNQVPRTTRFLKECVCRACRVVQRKGWHMEPLWADDPRQVGPIRLRGRLGGGGMGQVYLGRTRGGRPVAVKVVRSDLAGDAEFRRRFAIEVSMARRVGGFYTAQVVDADTDADSPWMATAYIPGPTLHQAVATHGPLPPAAIGVLGAGLAEGLIAIHEEILAHRDLKPGNVILAGDGPRVIDFGIARALEAASHSVSGAVIGTPAFMSPEQSRGGEVGPASDVFSLGAVLVFAATGCGPFGTGQGHAVMHRIRHDDPDLTGLPKDLVDLVDACLAKTPEHRPSPADLLDRLAASAESTTPWLPPTVTALITQLEEDLSEPSGGATIPGQAAPIPGRAADSTDRPAIDHALRIAGSIADPDEREEALYGVAYAIVEADPDHAEQYLRRIPSEVCRAVALLALADELPDRNRALRLVGHAEQLFAQHLDDGPNAVEHKVFVYLVDQLIAVDPQRALTVLDSVERRVVDFDDCELRAKALAATADKMAVNAPDHATELMARAVEVARMLPPHSDYTFLQPQTLAEIAKIGYAADRRHAEQLIDLAEAAALDVPGEASQRNFALKETAVEVARVDLARAEQIISKIRESVVRSCAWGDILKAAGSTRQDHRPLLDAAEQSVAAPAAQKPVSVKPASWWARWGAQPKVGAGQRNVGPWHLKYIATGAAWCDPSRAETIASRISDVEYRIEAFVDMAGALAETNPLQARWWLNTAYQTALEAEGTWVLPMMGRIAAAGRAVAAETAQQAAQYITSRADATDLSAQQLTVVARDVVAVDPELAMRLIDLAETRAQQPGKARLDKNDLERVATTLMAVAATAWADSRPERTGPILRHLLEVALAAGSTAYLSIIETAVPNPHVVEQLLREYRGPGRDHLRYIAVAAFAVTDAHRAEQLAQEITDDSLRYAALNALAVSITRQAMGSASGPETKRAT